MRERAVNKHGMGPWTRSLMISLLGTALALGAPVSSVSAQEVDARIQALERQMEEMRRTMQSMEAELEALRKAPPPEVVAAPTPVPPEEQPSVVRDQSPAETIDHNRGGDRAGRQLEPAGGQGLTLRPGEPGDQLRE